jgi:hypothetical protein
LGNGIGNVIGSELLGVAALKNREIGLNFAFKGRDYDKIFNRVGRTAFG